MRYDLVWLRQQYDFGVRPRYLFFQGSDGNAGQGGGSEVLNQWFPSAFTVDGICYRNAAHWMMVEKARIFVDMHAVSNLLAAKNDVEVKETGRHIAGFRQQHWDDRRYAIVKQGNLHKFSQHAGLREYLVSTKSLVLSEANARDTVWGIGLSSDSPLIGDPHQWKGLNLLGFALMETRDILSGEGHALVASSHY
jgi:ribA/ribD-fused uncharacterized protein